MPRTARASVGGKCYHALNRGNRRDTVFHKANDYEAFLGAIDDASARTPMDLLGYCASCPTTSSDFADQMYSKRAIIF
jgi:putative transposase